MAHVREQIRNRVATTLTGLSTTGASVYKMRRYALDDSKLPALCIYTTEEQSGLVTVGSRTLLRRLTVMVDALAVGASTAITDTLDTMCKEVEEALAADFTLGGLVKSTILAGTDTDINADGEKALGTATMSFAVQYITSIDDVETAR